MFSYFFRQLFNSFGIFFRTIRAFFTRRFIGLGARVRRMMNFSRHATQVASASFQGAATAMKKPTRREDYVETKWLFVSKSFLISLVLGLIAAGCLIYLVIWPFLLSRFFTAHFWQENDKVDTWSGKVVVYYDKEKDQPKYKGRLVDGVLQGKATEYDETGLVSFEGDFVDGQKTGQGIRYEAGVVVYEGGFEAGSYHGEGALYEDGVLTYQGKFVENVFSGNGTLYDENGNLLYKGTFEDGLYHGSGALYDENSDEAYSGGFLKGLFDGKGRLKKDGVLVYEGGFQQGLYHGEGMLYEDGSLSYKGGFSEGLREGEGTQFSPDGMVQYKGGYFEDLRSGEGVEYRDDGTIRYKGGFSEDLYQGSGTLYLDDDRGYIEAMFADGETEGDIRWFIDNKLWYAGGADHLVPDGFGELYTRSGKKIYAGEMDRGTIDGQWLLSLTAEEVREAFADATTAEKRADDGGFFVMNRELGVVVRCTYRSEEDDTGVFSTWISRQDTKMAWQDVQMFDSWVGDLKTDTSMTELMPWTDVDSFYSWVQGLQEDGPRSQVSFPEHEMNKERYYLDGWYCTAAIDLATGEPVMVSWTMDGMVQPQDTSEMLADEVKAAQEEVEALMEELGITPSEDAPVVETQPEAPAEGETDGETSAEPEQKPAGEEDIPEPVEGEVGYLLQTMDPDAVNGLVNSLLTFFENDRTLTVMQGTLPLLQEQLTAAQERLAMGTAEQKEVDDLQLAVEAHQLRISQSRANREKTLLAIQAVVEFDPALYNLKDLLFFFDPASVDEEALWAEVKNEDLITAKAAFINLKVAYETLLYSKKTLENVVDNTQSVADSYSRGDAEKDALSAAQSAQSDATAAFYSALTAFVREMNSLNHLTRGWLAQQVGWMGPVFDTIY